MSESITCPSGLRVQLRGWRVAELNILSNEQEMRKGTTIDTALSACIEGVDSPGPYAAPPAGAPLAMDGVLVCDRIVLLIGARIATHGPRYEFPVRCPSRACQKSYDWTIDLSKDLTVKPMPAESVETFKASNRFHAQCGDRRVTFRLITSAMERAAPVDRARMVTMSLGARVVEVEGVDSQDRLRWIEQLGGGAAAQLVDDMDEVDGGVETDIDVECPHCGHRVTVTLPFGPSFFVPKRRKKGLTSAR